MRDTVALSVVHGCSEEKAEDVILGPDVKVDGGRIYQKQRTLEEQKKAATKSETIKHPHDVFHCCHISDEPQRCS